MLNLFGCPTGGITSLGKRKERGKCCMHIKTRFKALDPALLAASMLMEQCQLIFPQQPGRGFLWPPACKMSIYMPYEHTLSTHMHKLCVPWRTWNTHNGEIYTHAAVKSFLYYRVSWLVVWGQQVSHELHLGGLWCVCKNAIKKLGAKKTELKSSELLKNSGQKCELWTRKSPVLLTHGFRQTAILLPSVPHL